LPGYATSHPPPGQKSPQRQTPAVRAEEAHHLFRAFIIIPPECQVKWQI
jgi:hypothetical protein